MIVIIRTPTEWWVSRKVGKFYLSRFFNLEEGRRLGFPTSGYIAVL